MATVTVEERTTILETEFRTELRHLATKADLEKLKSEVKTEIAHQTRWFVGGMIATMGVVVALERLWQ